MKQDLEKEKEQGSETKLEFQRLLDVFGGSYDNFETKEAIITQVVSWI